MTGPVWVAGASGGIGSACVRRLRTDGVTVIGTDRPDADVATTRGLEEAVARATSGGPLAGAVHAVGMSGRRLGDGPVSSCTDEAWDEVLRVNLTSAFGFLRACATTVADGGSIVLIGSALAGTLDEDFLTVAYRVAKAALLPLVQAAAYELAPRGVRVNVVGAGLVDTPMAARALSDDAIRGRFRELMPLSQRPATAEEIAAAVAWLLSADAALTTAAVLPVDGGWTLR